METVQHVQPSLKKFGSFLSREDRQSKSVRFTVKLEPGMHTRFQALRRHVGDPEPADVVRDALRIYGYFVESETEGVIRGYEYQGAWQPFTTYVFERLPILAQDRQKRAVDISIILNPELHTRFQAVLRHTGAFGPEQVILDALRRYEDVVVKEARRVLFGYRDESGWHHKPIFVTSSPE